jgi:glycosyltransferase involved in cell wall biosynthesis
MNISPFVVRDGIANKQSIEVGESALLDDLGLSPKRYVIFPCSFSSDEPVQEVIEAARMLPEIMFVMTWYTEKLSRNMRDTLPSNVILTGYLQIDNYNCLFANAGVALNLTLHEAVQLTCMQEAMAFEIPAVVSDLKTTRFLYKNYPVFVKNDSKSIAYGILHAFQNRLDIEERMKRLRIEWENNFFDQIVNLKSSLNL